MLVPMLDPVGQKKPYGHAVMDGVVPLTAHTNPAAHGSHAAAPATLKVPGAHTDVGGVDEVEPAAHA